MKKIGFNYDSISVNNSILSPFTPNNFQSNTVLRTSVDLPNIKNNLKVN